MIFDALRAIAGNWLTDIKPLVDAARLLHLPVTPHQVLPRKQGLEIMSRTSVDFRLPHPVTAIEDNASCVLLIDPKPGLTGLAEQRLFIDCVPFDADEDRYNDTPFERAICEALKVAAVPGVHAVCLGEISCPAQRAGSWLAMGQVLWVVTGTIAEQHTTISDFNARPESEKEAMTQGGLRNAMTAIEEVIMLRRESATAARH
jgi:hypothetical protein